MRSARPVALLVVALGLGTLSCGGCGDSGPELLLAGSYHLVGLSASTDGSQEVEALWGSIEADGAGLLTLTAMRNRNGTVDGPDTATEFPTASTRTGSCACWTQPIRRCRPRRAR